MAYLTVLGPLRDVVGAFAATQARARAVVGGRWEDEVAGGRRMLVLRDDVCTTPWCDAPVVHADHTHPVHAGGRTVFGNGGGECARCNGVKEADGWRGHVVRGSPHEIEVATPAGPTYRSSAPPLLGWGTDPPGPEADDEREHHPGPVTGSVLERRLESLLDAA